MSVCISKEMNGTTEILGSVMVLHQVVHASQRRFRDYASKWGTVERDVVGTAPAILWLLNSITGTVNGFSYWFTLLPTEATCDKPSNQVISIFLHYLILYVYGNLGRFSSNKTEAFALLCWKHFFTYAWYQQPTRIFFYTRYSS